MQLRLGASVIALISEVLKDKVQLLGTLVITLFEQVKLEKDAHAIVPGSHRFDIL